MKNYQTTFNIAQLRSSINQQFENTMQSVSTFFKEENDFFYRRGREKKTQQVVKNLILELNLSDEQTARIAAVELDYVKKVRAELEDQ